MVGVAITFAGEAGADGSAAGITTLRTAGAGGGTAAGAMTTFTGGEGTSGAVGIATFGVGATGGRTVAGVMTTFTGEGGGGGRGVTVFAGGGNSLGSALLSNSGDGCADSVRSAPSDGGAISGARVSPLESIAFSVVEIPDGVYPGRPPSPVSFSDGFSSDASGGNPGGGVRGITWEGTPLVSCKYA